jgi:hypothetical protein
MTACGKHGKTVKLFSHPSHSPWKSLRRFPHYHRHDYDEHEFLSKPVKTKTRRNDAQYHYPGGPNQMVKVGHAGIANSALFRALCAGTADSHEHGSTDGSDFAQPEAIGFKRMQKDYE